MTSFELHEKAMMIARNIKRNDLELFEVLLEMDRDQVFLGFDVTSLKAYCVELLQLSPNFVKDMITVVNKSIEVPALAEVLRSGKTTIYKARKICAILTNDNAHEWISLACECSARVIEKCVAIAKPREAVHESMTYVSEDPVKKTKRALKRTSSPAKPSKVKRESDRRARYRAARVEHEVNLRDQGQCAHVRNDGTRCEAKRWLQKHHIVEFADGGGHTVENLVTLCSAHHRMLHRHAGVT